MVTSNKQQWKRLEEWSPRSFILAAVFLLVGAANSGLAFFVDSYTFNEWLGIVLELGRLAALLGTAGLSVVVVNRSVRLGYLTRAVASLAVVFVTALTAMATLTVAGVLADPIGVVGLLAYVLSVSAFLVVGVGVVRTGAYSRRIGGLLLVNVVALLIVFFERVFIPLGLVATVVPALQILLYLGVAYDSGRWAWGSGSRRPRRTERRIRRRCPDSFHATFRRPPHVVGSSDDSTATRPAEGPSTRSK